ncbi:MAG: hypothetical protein AAGK00_10755 [Pseudomonadota bacterium]
MKRKATSSLLVFVLALSACVSPEQQANRDRREAELKFATSSLDNLAASGKAVVVLTGNHLYTAWTGKTVLSNVSIGLRQPSSTSEFAFLSSKVSGTLITGFEVVPVVQVLEAGDDYMDTFGVEVPGIKRVGGAPGMLYRSATGNSPDPDFTVRPGEVLNLGTIEFFFQPGPSGDREDLIWRAVVHEDWKAGSDALVDIYPTLAQSETRRTFGCVLCLAYDSQ